MVERAQLKVQEAQMEAALTTLQHVKEVAAAVAELDLGESSGAVDVLGIPHDSK